MSEEYRKEIPREQCRPDPKFGMKPTGHVIPKDPYGYGPSACDDSMEFRVPDCGVKAGGEFSDPFFLDERDLPTPENQIKNKQGF